MRIAGILGMDTISFCTVTTDFLYRIEFRSDLFRKNIKPTNRLRNTRDVELPKPLRHFTSRGLRRYDVELEDLTTNPAVYVIVGFHSRLFI